MDMSGMSMGTDMGSGVPSRFDLQKMFWAVVGAAIGCATLVNVYNQLLYRQRYADSRNFEPASDG